jgi:hypothetical protein
MENKDNQRLRDPSADTCFLGGSIDASPDSGVPMEAPNETASDLHDIDVSFPPAVSSDEIVDSTGSGPGVTHLKNHATSASPTLPSGELIDSKNTLQSFHIPVNDSGCNDLLVTSNLPPSDINVASRHLASRHCPRVKSSTARTHCSLSRRVRRRLQRIPRHPTLKSTWEFPVCCPMPTLPPHGFHSPKRPNERSLPLKMFTWQNSLPLKHLGGIPLCSGLSLVFLLWFVPV